ncbi:sulfite exporter TauE/SafE family protein [Leptospira kemamanensis]|uniref:Probable membrane transporter protein n=1 Tax=Leptospira kemamanensis TaxID=2484942 RepID=A0A4R9JSL2_9LEPT|nr:TSUP family transporter [Leptospira kemamanensis]TGL55708.1 sulfite exporter TauE/SafE family protein [Leptospira kemamanensis]
MSLGILFLILGIGAGILGGLVGIGGGILLVPALVYFFDFNQKLAQGTTLAAMVPPIGIVAAYIYYTRGETNLFAAALISVGFILGSVFGAGAASKIDTTVLSRFFGIFTVIVGLKMVFFPK